MKKILTMLLALTLLVGLMGTLSVSAAGSVNVWVGSTTVNIGDTLTVTLAYNGGGVGIGSLDAKFTYNASVFEYLSCSGATANGGAGVVTISYYSSDIVAADTLSITLNFRALAPGDGNFTLTTEGMYSDDDTLLGTPSKTVEVTASNPTLSGNADLKSLVPSKGTLSPKFDPNVTEYTISVAHSVTSLSLSATTDHSGAKTSISGKNALEVGKNTRVVTVTAPNGTTKKYTVVITRAAAPSTTTGTNKPTTGTTLPQPADDALEVMVNGKPFTILDTQASTDLPEGFSWGTVLVNLVEVPAAISTRSGMTLLYLVSEEKIEDGFYIYDADKGSLTRYRNLQVDKHSWLLHDLPAGDAPVGTVKGTLSYDGGTVGAYVYEDAALSDFYVVWAAPVDGDAAWYVYDKKEGTLQRYYATPAEPNDVVTIPQKPTEEDKDDVKVAADTDSNSNPLLFAGIGAGVMLVLVILVAILASGGKRKGKH